MGRSADFVREPGAAYRLLRGSWRIVAACLRFRVEVEGLDAYERLAGSAGSPGVNGAGWIVAGLPHRMWIDPFLLWGWLPARPRLVFFGDEATMTRDPLRRAAVRLVGGVVPIPTTHAASALAGHLAAAHRALAAGAPFCLFPETGRPSPPGTIRRLGGGFAYIALRERCRIVPVVIGGNDELFLGRRIVARILPPLDPLVLAGLDPAGPLPPPGSTEERDAAHRLAAAFAAHVAGPVAEAHRDAAPPAGMRRRARWLTHLFR